MDTRNIEVSADKEDEGKHGESKTFRMERIEVGTVRDRTTPVRIFDKYDGS